MVFPCFFQSCQEVSEGGSGGGLPEQELYLQALFTLLDVLGRWVKDMLDTLSAYQGQPQQQQSAKQLVSEGLAAKGSITACKGLGQGAEHLGCVFPHKLRSFTKVGTFS